MVVSRIALEKLFILWLCLFSIVVLPNSYEGAKVLWLWAGCIPLFIYFIIALWKNTELQFLQSDYFYFLWLVLLAISSVFGLHPIDSLVGGSYRHQGVIFFLALWVVGKTIALLSKKQKQRIYSLLIYGGLLQVILLIFQRIYYSVEPLGTFGNANAAAGFIALTLFLPSPVVSKGKKIFSYAITLAAITLTSSVSSVLVFLIAISNFKKWVLVAVMVLAIVLAGSSTNIDNPHEGRAIIWEYGLKAVRERPLLGYGAESNEVVYGNLFIKNGQPLNGLIIDRTHNVFLDVTIWSGFIGTALFTFWLYLKFGEIKVAGGWEAYALIGWLLFAFVQPLGVVHWLMLMVILY